MRDAGATYVDVTAEANGIVTDTGSAWRWFGLGAVAAFATIVVGLREPLSSCAWQVRSRGQI